MTSTIEQLPKVGLRERKKARTRAAIQEQAPRLFRDKGYDATTVEQIAEAAEVSPSTFFRYFPTKEDVVAYDALDPRFADAFREQPREASVVQAIRGAMRVAIGDISDADLELQRERERLVSQVPGLQSKVIEDFARTYDLLAGLVAERTGRSVTDPEVRSLCGAVIGIGIADFISPAGTHHFTDFAGRMQALDTAIAQLEVGFKL